MPSSRWLLLPLVLAVLASCTSTPSAISSRLSTGSMQLTVSPTVDVSHTSRVTLTISGADFDPIITDLVLTDGAWGGVIGRVPAGAHRTFSAQAFDSSNHLTYQGKAEDVTVTPDTTGLVSLTLQSTFNSTPSVYQDPFIDSLVASATTVSPGGTISLSASAHNASSDPVMSYHWSAPSGTFSTPTASTSQWTAPSTPGPVTLTLSAGYPWGVFVSVSRTLTVYVSASGSEQVSVGFNNAPQVLFYAAAPNGVPSPLDVGQSATVAAYASDPERDTFTYQWSATCPGTLSGQTTDTVTFTPSALPAAACNNCQLNVTVDDGHGGRTTSGVALCVAKNPSSAPPSITRSFQSSATAKAGQALTFEVEASDPAGSALTFGWAAGTGSTSPVSTSATVSRVTWTAPKCAAPGSITGPTATATNAAGLKATQAFSVTGLPACP